MEWTGSSSGFPLEAKWAKIQPMRVSGVTVTSAAVKLIPGEMINFTARVTVLTPMGVDPLNVTTGAAWTVTGGKGYSMADGRLTVKANETAQALTVTAKYGTDSGGTAASNQDGTLTVPAGTIVIPPIGPSVTINSEAAVDENGDVTLPGGGSAVISGTAVILPDKGGTLTSNSDGTVGIPSGSKIAIKSGKRTTVPPQGGTLGRDGAYEDNVSPRSPKRGDTVTVTPMPNGNYEVDNVVVTDSSGRLELRDNRDGAYSFTQPNETVTVEATFVPRSQTMPFFGVWPNDWCYEAVRYVNSRGIMGGYGDGTLRPKEQTTRAQAAAMLTRFCEKI